MSNSRLDQQRMVDPVLTTIAQGYSNASMVAGSLFPIVSVSKLKGKIPVFGREAFIIRDMDRAIRAQSNRIAPQDLSMINFETREKDIEIALDYIEEEESPDVSRLEHRIARQLMDTLYLSREKEAADLVQNPDNYTSSLKLEIDSANAFNDYSLSIDPVKIIKDCMSSVRNRIARYPNTLVIGDSAYQALINHPKVIDRIKYSGISKITTAILASLLDLNTISVGLAVYTDNGTDFSDIWNDNIILAYVDSAGNNSRSEFNPSFGYTFQRQGKPEIDNYTDFGGKLRIYRATDNYCIKVTASDAAFLIYNTNH